MIKRILLILFILVVIPSLVFAVTYTYKITNKFKDTVQSQSNGISQNDQLRTIKEQQKEVDTFASDLMQTVKEKDPTAAFQKLQILINSNKNALAHCHSLAHSIGDSAIEKYKDVTAAMQYANEICGSGYIHGIIETKIGNSQNIYNDLLTLCPKYSGNCIHGVGHGLMNYTDNDIPKALSYCNVFGDSTQKVWCSEGVFMENYNSDVSIHASKYLKPDDPSYPCSLQEEIYKGSCYFYSSDYYLSLHPSDYSGAFQLCYGVEPNYIQTCINGVGSRTMKRNILDPKFVEGNCMKLDAQYQNACIDGMVSYYIVNYYSLSKGKELCSQLETSNQIQCLKSVDSRKDNFPQ